MTPVNKKNLADITDSYLKVYNESDKKVDVVDGQFKQQVDTYYDLCTDFYEYGWGEGFHFASMNKGESREHAFAKHEYRLALKLGLKKGDTVLVG